MISPTTWLAYGAAGGLSGSPAFDLAVTGGRNAAASIAALSAQLSSGYLSADYAVLGSAARGALDLSGAISRSNSVSAALDQAASLLSTQQAALAHVQSLAGSLVQNITLAQTTGTDISGIAASARSALVDLANTLDVQFAGGYAFAGADSAAPPIPDPGTILQSPFFTAISTAVAGLAGSGAAGVAAATLAASLPGATSPFAPSLEGSNQRAVTTLGNGVVIGLGVLADQNAYAVSSGAGSTSTGSYMRDVMRALATISSLTPAQSTDPNYPALLADTKTSLSGAVSALGTDIAGLGADQQRITATQADLADSSSVLASHLSKLQDADLPSVAASLSAAQTQLQASYRVIATLGTLSLANYI